MITFRFLFKIREMRSGCMRGSRKCVQRMRFRGIFKFARRVRGIFSINLHYNLRNFNFQEVGGGGQTHPIDPRMDCTYNCQLLTSEQTGFGPWASLSTKISSIMFASPNTEFGLGFFCILFFLFGFFICVFFIF